MFRVIFHDVRHRLVCLVTRDKARVDASAGRLLAVMIPWLEAGGGRSGIAWWAYRQAAWTAFYLTAPVRAVRGW